MKYRILFLFFLLTIGFSVHAFSQNTITIYKLQDLSFGTVTAGFQKDILPGTGESAQFEIISTQDDKLALQFNLPSAVSTSNGQLSISFRHNSACWAYANSPTQRQIFDPNQGTEIVVQAKQPVYIWIGSSVSLMVTQQAGSYTSSITLTVTSIGK